MAGKPVRLVRRAGPRIGVVLPRVQGLGSDPGPIRPLQPLTPREAAVAQLVIDGLSRKAIAQRLRCEVSTVKSHLTHLEWKIPGNRPLAQRLVLWGGGYPLPYLFVAQPDVTP